MATAQLVMLQWHKWKLNSDKKLVKDDKDVGIKFGIIENEINHF